MGNKQKRWTDKHENILSLVWQVCLEKKTDLQY